MNGRWLRSVPAALAFLVVLCALPGLAFAQPRVIQTDCDTLSLDPPLVRVTFGVANLGTIPICSLRLTPVQSGTTPADSCRILECSTPPTGWTCTVNDTVGSATWRVTGETCIEQGDKHDGFDILLDPLFCCYLAEFDTTDGSIFYTDIVCFECDKPVSIRKSTWGYLKTLHR
jgi:hypothetical protein